jgi:hypothetical protein
MLTNALQYNLWSDKEGQWEKCEQLLRTKLQRSIPPSMEVGAPPPPMVCRPLIDQAA